MAIHEFIEQVNSYRQQQSRQTMLLISGAVVQANAAFQSYNAERTLMKSGGVMTPEVRMAQLNAQQAQFNAQLFTAMIINENSKSASSVSALSGGMNLPTVSRQLSDPRLSVKAPSLVTGFATQASHIGGASIEPEARQVIKAVEDMRSYRQMGGVGSDMSQAGQFMEMFGNFVTQVQGIKGAQ